MSKIKTFKTLKELGGEATYQEIKKKAKEKYPNSTLHTYIIKRLRSLKDDKVIKEIRIDGEKGYKIKKENPQWGKREKKEEFP